MRDAVRACHSGPVALAGYREPSAVFHLGTQTRLLGGNEVAPWLSEGDEPAGLRHRPGGAPRRVRSRTAGATRLACFTGFNMNGGDVLRLTLYGVDRATPPRAANARSEDIAAPQQSEPRWARLLQ